jgi:hypothetical protein
VPAGAGAAASAEGGTGAPSSAVTAWVPVRPPTDLALLEAPAEVVGAPEAMGVVVPPFMARVVRIHVRAGEHVARGAPVVAVVMPQLVSAAGSYMAAVTRMEAWGARREQLLRLRAEGLVRAAELAEVETRLADARAEQQTALATLRSGGLGAADARRLLDEAGVVVLRSPVEGTVLEVDAVLGEARDAAGRPLVRVGGGGATRIEARFAHRPLSVAGKEGGARFELVSALGRHELRLLSMAPVIDPRDGTLRCWFETATPGQLPQLPPGLTGRVRVIPAPDAGMLVVPATAVVLEGDRAYVVVREGVGGRKVPVEVLASSGTDALVRGLSKGQEVATEGRAAAAEAAAGARATEDSGKAGDGRGGERP